MGLQRVGHDWVTSLKDGSRSRVPSGHQAECESSMKHCFLKKKKKKKTSKDTQVQM